MGLINDCLCVFCNTELETREHLFLQCPTATLMWETAFTLSGLQFTFCSWDVFVERACSTWRGKSMLTMIMKLLLNALVYLLWEERNKRMFQGRSRPASELLKTVKDVISLQLRGRIFKRVDVNISLCNHWRIVDC
ncbi:uncharacterized protein LOC120125606 [Hibiscus syriacus]|uniref:uncharacterized protein LOC120125606 n=1 Tax=Hibiscus syriacus TaxID=106335 RepID=UPI001924967B|nr:uncharacterized protein LOC120125606 [Hibiscus syriacus]